MTDKLVTSCYSLLLVYIQMRQHENWFRKLVINWLLTYLKQFSFSLVINLFKATELRKADRTVGVNSNIFSNISSGTA